MKPPLDSLSTNELVQRFIDIAIAQDDAMLHDKTAAYNRLFREMVVVANALKVRDDDARMKLTELYGHPNRQVRLKAAIYTLALKPREARAVLQKLSDAGDLPQALDAGMTLFNLDRGIFKPT
jgi:hypothetical protein